MRKHLVRINFYICLAKAKIPQGQNEAAVHAKEDLGGLVVLQPRLRELCKAATGKSNGIVDCVHRSRDLA